METADKIFGLRAWGLYLYGSLAAYLPFFGILDIKSNLIEDVPKLILLSSSLLPVFVIFLLIKARYRIWYLTTDRLFIRALITTLLIIIISSLICGMSLIVRNDYEISFSLAAKYRNGIAEALLMAVICLTVSSTLFIAVLLKTLNLPGLPTQEFIKKQNVIRSNLKFILSSGIKEELLSGEEMKELQKKGKEIEKNMKEIENLSENYFAKKYMSSLLEHVNNFNQVLYEMIAPGSVDKELKWKKYIKQETSSDKNNKKSISVKEIFALKLGK